jgi:NADH:ubiquinone oxidoreductase subunit E
MIEIKICCGKHCSTLGGMNLLNILEEDPYLKRYCSISAVSCMEQCCDGEKSPTIMINGKPFVKATPELVQEEVRKIIEKSEKSA